MFGDSTPPEQVELTAISNALHAALGYSPHIKAPPEHPDLHAYVTRRVQGRFWDHVFVLRPEVRDIILKLHTGQVVLVSGEMGTGKSTAIQAAMRELEGKTVGGRRAPVPAQAERLAVVLFDANKLSGDMHTPDQAASMVHKYVFRTLKSHAVRDAGAWAAFLYEHDDAYDALRDTFKQDGFDKPTSPREWRELCEMDEYSRIRETCNQLFAEASDATRLRALLAFIGERTPYEPLIVLDDIDQLLDEVQVRCAEVLFEIIASSDHRVRGMIAVRPESRDAIQASLDTATRPPDVAMVANRLMHEVFERPSIGLTMEFVSKRIEIVQEPETTQAIRDALDPRALGRLAAILRGDGAGADEHDVEDFFEALMEMLRTMVYEVFRVGADEEIDPESWGFALAVHSWHNGSLRDCGMSITAFVSDILQDRTHMYELRTLLHTVIASRREMPVARWRRLRRITRSLLYRHLLFWGAQSPRPPKCVMVFDGVEKDTDPPLHFLRLRVLQHLAHRRRGSATVKSLRWELSKLGVTAAQLDEALLELSTSRIHEDAGLVRVDRPRHRAEEAELEGDTKVQLLPAGEFLVDKLCVSTEYLFWSALSSPAAVAAVGVRGPITSEDMQSDAYRATIAARFVKDYLVDKLRDEHPYLDGVTPSWPREAVRARLLLYQNLFGFSSGRWLLTKCCSSMMGFIPSFDPRGEFQEAKDAIKEVRQIADRLDHLAKPRSEGRRSST